MIQVENVEFDERFDSGDAVLVSLNDTISIFYLLGPILNGEFLPGELQFVKDKQGNRRCLFPKQHKSALPEIEGSYRRPNEREKSNLTHFLNGFSPPWQIISAENILGLLKGTDTFRYHAKDYEFVKRLLQEFPDARFAEVGSSNVGLDSRSSDLDIYVYNDYERVMLNLRKDPERFGLTINKTVFREDISRHSAEYGFSEQKAEKICHHKLSGLEFMGRELAFFDARENPVFKKLFNPNCSEPITIEGKVIAASFAGHHTVSYDIKKREKYSVILLRRKFQKGKRYILEKGDFAKLSGKLVHRDPNLIITDDLSLTL